MRNSCVWTVLLYVGLCANLLIVSSASAAVKVEATGFVVTEDLIINSSPSKVYEALIGKVRKWWNPEHTYSGDSKNLFIEAKPGGCFCEKFPKGGGVEHMRIVYLSPNSTVIMSGALGPLQTSGLAGALTWQVSAVDGRTTLKLKYVVGGYMQGGFDQMAPAVDAVLTDQIDRLKLYVETGKAGVK
jgi:uncharacterized protein YndB with AHSA1/START domain